MNTKKKTIYNMVLIAMFAALAFGFTFIKVQLGVYKIHLGNFVPIIAGLLCGGLVGGASGAIGMALNDLCSGYGPDTIIRTVIVKFLLGFIAGTLFRYVLRKEKKVDWTYLLLSSIFMTIFITFLALYINYGEAITVGNKTLKNSLFLIISSGVITLVFAILLIISKFTKLLKPIQKYTLFVASITSIINVALEFGLKIPFKVWFGGLSWMESFYYAVSSLPTAIVTTIITIAMVTVIYFPVYVATKRFNKLDDLYLEIQKATSSENKEIKE